MESAGVEGRVPREEEGVEARVLRVRGVRDGEEGVVVRWWGRAEAEGCFWSFFFFLEAEGGRGVEGEGGGLGDMLGGEGGVSGVCGGDGGEEGGWTDAVGEVEENIRC